MSMMNGETCNHCGEDLGEVDEHVLSIVCEREKYHTKVFTPMHDVLDVSNSDIQDEKEG